MTLGAVFVYNASMKHWTKEEETILLELRSEGMSFADIAEVLDRTVEAVRTRNKRLNPGAGVSRSWSTDDIATLSQELNYDELALKLGKTRRAVQAKCEMLGISKMWSRKGGTGTMYPDEQALLYLVDFGKYKKVGVTQQTLENRFKQDSDFILLDSVFMNLDEALETEHEILQNLKNFRVLGEVRRGFGECFDCKCLEDLL